MAYEYRTIYLSDSSTGVDDTTGAIPGIAMEKTITVPTNRYYRIVSLRATAVSAAAAGSRQLVFTVDPGSTSDTTAYIEVRAGAVQVANLTRYYIFAPNVDRLTAFADTDWITSPIPDVELPPGSVIRVFDEAAIGSTAAPDDLDIRAIIQSRGGIA